MDKNWDIIKGQNDDIDHEWSVFNDRVDKLLDDMGKRHASFRKELEISQRAISRNIEECERLHRENQAALDELLSML